MDRRIASIAVALAAFAVAFGGLSLVNGGPEARSERAAVPRSAARDVEGWVARADGHLQAVRETGDASQYARAETLLRRAAGVRPRDSGVLVGLGNLALARHEFRAALRHGRAARVAAPETVRPYAVLVDALIELGRYEEAGRSLQRMIDLKPNLASYARVSYFKELHGDLPGAIEAMELAVSAGSGTAEGVAYVQTLLGNLEFERGRIAPSRRAYLLALQQFPGHVPAEAGLARVDAATGRLARAIARMQRIVDRLPLPEHVVTLGELELAAGRRAAATERFALVDAQRRLLASAGVNTDVEIALSEADHGDVRRAVRLGRAAWRAAPSIRSADALAWALTRAGRAKEGLRMARRAVKLGSRDPLILTHAGLTARLAGDRALARRYLSRALEGNPRFSALWAPRAHRALEAVS